MLESLFPGTDREICESKGILNELIKLSSFLRYRYGMYETKIAKNYTTLSGFKILRGKPCVILDPKALPILLQKTNGKFNVSLGSNLLLWYDENILTLPPEYIAPSQKLFQPGLFQ